MTHSLKRCEFQHTVNTNKQSLQHYNQIWTTRKQIIMCRITFLNWINLKTVAEKKTKWWKETKHAKIIYPLKYLLNAITSKHFMLMAWTSFSSQMENTNIFVVCFSLKWAIKLTGCYDYDYYVLTNNEPCCVTRNTYYGTTWDPFIY